MYIKRNLPLDLVGLENRMNLKMLTKGTSVDKVDLSELDFDLVNLYIFRNKEIA